VPFGVSDALGGEMVMVITATDAPALLVGSATLVAVTVCPPAVDGAVYNPPVLTVPTVLFPPFTPSTDQVTAVFVVPVTVAVNCCVPPSATIAVVGEMVTVIVGGGGVITGVMVTVAFALLVGSALATAVTVTCTDTLVVGAVYRPLLEIVPFCAFPPTTLFTSHCTVVLLEPVTVAWNCCVPPEVTLALVGEIVIETVGVPPEPLPPLPLELPPPQPVIVRRTHAAVKKDTGQRAGRDMKGLKAGLANVRVDEQQLWRVASDSIAPSGSC
jgi:hypothetical protein